MTGYGARPEVGWREALRLGGIDLRELRCLGWRGWLWEIATVAVALAAAWLLS